VSILFLSSVLASLKKKKKRICVFLDGKKTYENEKTIDVLVAFIDVIL